MENSFTFSGYHKRRVSKNDTFREKVKKKSGKITKKLQKGIAI